MDNPLVDSIRDHLNDYLDGRCSRQDFKLWLAGVSWDPANASNPRALRFAGEIALQFDLVSGGLLSEDEIRDDLLALSQPSAAFGLSR